MAEQGVEIYNRDIFVKAVRNLMRKRRNQEMKHRFANGVGSEEPKKWLWKNLYNGDASFFRDIAKGRTLRQPSRNNVLRIAYAFNCTLEEQNELLRSAGHLILCRPPTTREMQIIRDTAFTLLHYLPLPGYLATSEWDIIEWNPIALKLFGLSSKQAREIIRNGSNNILELLVNPEYPIYERVSCDKKSWEQLLYINVVRFKMHNRNSQQDEWYREIEERIVRRFSVLEEIWDRVHIEPGDDKVFLPEADTRSSLYKFAFKAPNGEIVHLCPVLIPVSNQHYPVIISYIPALGDSRSCKILSDLIPTPLNDWKPIDSRKRSNDALS